MKELHEETTFEKAKLAAEVKAKGFESPEIADHLELRLAVVRQSRASVRDAVGGQGRALRADVRHGAQPYFFAVDEQGQQLLDIHRITHR